MATVVGVAQAVLFVLVALVFPSGGQIGFHWYDRLGLVLVSAAIATLLWRFARLAVMVDEEGMVVRNLSADRRLAWPEVLAVRFGGGQPWVTLDLADGEPMAVMAIQRADGAYGEAEAHRLARLVVLHTRTEHDG
jgi:hypothetical protein